MYRVGAAHLKQPLLVIWDGARAHHSHFVRDYLDTLGGHIQIAYQSAIWSMSTILTASALTQQNCYWRCPVASRKLLLTGWSGGSTT